MSNFLAPRRLIKLPAVCEYMGKRPTSIYSDVKAGLFPPPIKLTLRSSAWVEDEVGVMTAAVIAGKSEGEIRKLVLELVAARSQAVEVGLSVGECESALPEPSV